MSEDKDKEIETLVEEAEALRDAQNEVEKELEIEEAEEAAKTSVWKSIRNMFCRTVKAIVTIACKLIKSEILFIINNENNQKLAKVAVLTAMKLGLKSNAAWAAAWAVLTAGDIFISPNIKVKATDIKKNVLETLLQLIYCCVANKNDKSVVVS